MDTPKDIYIYTLKMYIKKRIFYVSTKRTCYVYKHNELVMYPIKRTL